MKMAPMARFVLCFLLVVAAGWELSLAAEQMPPAPDQIRVTPIDVFSGDLRRSSRIPQKDLSAADETYLLCTAWNKKEKEGGFSEIIADVVKEADFVIALKIVPKE